MAAAMISDAPLEPSLTSTTSGILDDLTNHHEVEGLLESSPQDGKRECRCSRAAQALHHVSEAHAFCWDAVHLDKSVSRLETGTPGRCRRDCSDDHYPVVSHRYLEANSTGERQHFPVTGTVQEARERIQPAKRPSQEGFFQLRVG